MMDALIDQLNPEGSDEEDDPAPLTEFVFELGEDDKSAPVGCVIAPKDCRAVIVCAPGPATVYLRTVLPSLTQTPWRLKLVKEPERLFPPPPKPTRFLAAGGVKQAVAVAVLEREIPADLAFAWASALLAGFPEASEVIFIDRIARADWRLVGEQERPQEPHLAGLWTSAWSSEVPCINIAALPSPNFLSGLAAALLSLCEAARKRGLVALALQDGAHAMASTLVGFEALRPLLSDLGLECEKAADFVGAMRMLLPPPSLSIYA